MENRTLTTSYQHSLDNKTKSPKALALLSGGLDSMLAIKLILHHGVDIEAVNFVMPFSVCDNCSMNKFAEELNLKVHRVFFGQEFLNIVASPPHGYGSQMNPCIDCRILMFKKAKKLAKKIGADFIVTGEVLNERPFSQRKDSMLHIEREAGLERKILRPLSAKLLPESEPEKRGLINRDRLLDISGRRRLSQIELARNLGIESYPSPSGGCLLTEPRFAERLKEHLKNDGKLTLEDALLLKIGRHFRADNAKIIVGRNEDENNRLLVIAKSRGIPYLEAVDYEGPVVLYVGKEKPNLIDKAAALTVRYSDAPKGIHTKVVFRMGTDRILEMGAIYIDDKELENLRV